VRGETGTGKEFISQLLHAQSRRAKGPLVRFNCAAIPAELAEAELFGHTRGAFTGAATARAGFFAEANGGTLILDEIGELPLGVQAKLLRALQEGEIQPVGSGRVEKVDVRIVASTNRDLAADVRAGTFREDLYYRLAVVELVVPPLRDRRSDIPALAAEFARRYGDKFGTGALAIEPALLDALAAASWPGNVRQLENAIARLAALATSTTLSVADWTEQSAHHAQAEPEPAPEVGDTAGSAELGPSLKEQVEAFERGVLARVLAATNGNQSEAARRLGTSRVTLVDKLKKYGLTTRKND
jgi:two-component system response regulator AtoC